MNRNAPIRFSATQVSQLTGLSARQLRYYEQTWLLVPEIASASGGDHVRLYFFRNFVIPRVIRKCRDAGANLQNLRHVGERLGGSRNRGQP